VKDNMSSLILNFGDIYKSVSRFLGWNDEPTDKQLKIVKDIVLRGYRQFLYPINARTGTIHTWSFLVKHDILHTKNNEWVYKLPEDFNRIVVPFRHEKDSGYPAMQPRPVELIHQMRAGVESTNYPHFYAIRTGPYVKEIGTTYEVIFFETPNTDYYLNYAYVFRPDKPSAITDVFVGGDIASEAILENCLAVAESQEDNILAVHNQIAEKLTQQLIQVDTVTVSDSVGKNIDTGVRYISFERPLPLTETENIYP